MRYASAIAFCVSVHAQTFVDLSNADLAKRVPELAKMEFAGDQAQLVSILQETGWKLADMIGDLPRVNMAEEVHAMRFVEAQMAWSERRDPFTYTLPGDTRTPATDSITDFLIASKFINMLSPLMPENQGKFRFRLMGQPSAGTAVVAFTDKAGSAEGLYWIDEASHQVRRARMDFLAPARGDKFDSFIRDVRFATVSFGPDTVVWLPSAVVVHANFPKGEFHSVHRFSSYIDVENGQKKGKTADVTFADDPYEILIGGLNALRAKDAAAALPALDAASAQISGHPELHFYQGSACLQLKRMEDAEAHMREFIKAKPAFAIAHNELGDILYARGDKTAAVAEFQEALRLDPGNAGIKANLDAVTAQTSGPVIKVDVRQVLVPVVVTDKEGHHITGLKQTDFTVFEDGVEQKITGFSSERSDVKAGAEAAGQAPSDSSTPASAAAANKPLATRSTFMVVLDLSHLAFGNFVFVRQALEKLFKEEQAGGDTRYLMVALGRSFEVLQNTTADPAQVLATINTPHFKKLFQANSTQNDIRLFERDLQEVRTLCDQHDPSCPSRKRELPNQAMALTEHQSYLLTEYGQQLKFAVDQLGHFPGRRTMVLLSDGFSLAPGMMPYSLLEAYFPEFRSTRSIERQSISIDPVYRVAAASNVVIYTVDSRGLYTSPAYDASRAGATGSTGPQVDRAINAIASEAGMTLAEIAATTGGTAFQNRNDLLTGMKRAFADGREYYMLAYASANDAQDGKFRKIEVVVKDRKAKVSAKRGYWAAAENNK